MQLAYSLNSMLDSATSHQFSIPTRIYVEDTDVGGIVYYVNYLKYMERARTEWLRSIGIEKTSGFEWNIMFVVHSVDCKYLAPARLDDLLEVSAQLIDVRRTWLLFEQKVMKDKQVLAQATVKVACVNNQTLKPTRLPDVIGQRLPTIRS